MLDNAYLIILGREELCYMYMDSEGNIYAHCVWYSGACQSLEYLLPHI